VSFLTLFEQVADAPNPGALQRTLFNKADGWYERPSAGPALKFVSFDATGRITVNQSIPNPYDTGVYALYVDYTASGSPAAANEVQYTRIWLSAGVTITKMRTHIRGGANGVRQFKMALFSQAAPTSNTGTPNIQVATTLADAPPGAFTGQREVSLTSYLVPTSGWYWTALQVDNPTLSFLVSVSYPATSVQRREENPGVFTMPSPAGVTTQPASAVLFIAAVE